MRDFVEKPSSDEVDTNLISAGAYVLEREILELVPPERNVSIEREVWPQLIGNGLYGFPSESYWLDIGTPERYLQGTFDILEGNVQTGRRASASAATGSPSTPAPRCTGGSIPPAVIERGVRVAEGAHVGSLVVLGADVSVGAGTTVERSVILDGAADRRGLRAARLHRRAPACRIGDGTQITGGAVLGEGVTRGGGQRDHPRGAYLPGCAICPTARSSSRSRRSQQPPVATTRPRQESERADERRRRHATPTAQELSREAIARSTPPTSSATCSRCPSTCATRCGGWSRAIMEDWDTPAGLVVAGMGGSAIGGALARAALGDQASRPIFVDARLRAAAVDDARHDGAVRELLRQHRGDARLLRVGRRARRAGAIGRHRPAAGWPSMARADGVPVIPLPGGFQPRAAVAYMIVARARGGGAVRRRRRA